MSTFRKLIENTLKTCLLESNFKEKDMKAFSLKMTNDPTAPNYTPEQVTNKINKIYRETNDLVLTRAIVQSYLRGYFQYNQIDDAIEKYKNLSKDYEDFLDKQIISDHIVLYSNWFADGLKPETYKSLDKKKNAVISQRNEIENKKQKEREEYLQKAEDWDNNAILICKYPYNKEAYYHPRLKTFVLKDGDEWLFETAITKELLDKINKQLIEEPDLDFSDYVYYDYCNNWSSNGYEKEYSKYVIPKALEVFGNNESYEKALNVFNW